MRDTDTDATHSEQELGELKDERDLYVGKLVAIDRLVAQAAGSYSAQQVADIARAPLACMRVSRADGSGLSRNLRESAQQRERVSDLFERETEQLFLRQMADIACAPLACMGRGGQLPRPKV